MYVGRGGLPCLAAVLNLICVRSFYDHCAHAFLFIGICHSLWLLILIVACLTCVDII